MAEYGASDLMGDEERVVLQSWELGEIGGVCPAGHGLMNRVLFVETRRGIFVLRSYEYLNRS